ncbi:MAG TPA: trypsin-like peptidase domain-containing protein [Gemmataceae bacterium]|nr:trypsin-like peptidase domain-containing protein [Gemmataceae bacterium]
MWQRLGLLLLVCVCSFGGGTLAFLVIPNSPRVTAQSPAALSNANIDAGLLKLSDRFETVANKVSPAVVSIEATKAAAPGKSRPVEESGSGVIIQGEVGKNAYVITNNHVITGASAEQITISLSDGRVFQPGQVWADPESDVAILRLDRGGLPTATFGDSDKVHVGQWVIAIGSPFGLNQSVTHGIISARERGQISLGGAIRIKDFLQTDAAINPGSSGGPLLNLDGEVIGINTAIASHSNSNSGVAFSIPINMVRKVARQLLEKGSVSRGFLGLHLSSNFEAGDALKLGLENANGALVDSVYPDTPAATAGIKTGDVVLQLDNTAIRNENQLINLISAMPAGQKVRLQIWRNRQVQTLYAVVGDWSAAQARLKPAPAQ